MRLAKPMLYYNCTQERINKTGEIQMATKRTIRGEKYDIAALIDDAISHVDSSPLDTANAKNYLRLMGHTAPTEELINRVAREMAILKRLSRATSANFDGQIGKISFDNRDKAIEQANAYLDRRNQAHRSRWGK
jgi:hypothetical protein